MRLDDMRHEQGLWRCGVGENQQAISGLVILHEFPDAAVDDRRRPDRNAHRVRVAETITDRTKISYDPVRKIRRKAGGVRLVIKQRVIERPNRRRRRTIERRLRVIHAAYEHVRPLHASCRRALSDEMNRALTPHAIEDHAGMNTSRYKQIDHVAVSSYRSSERRTTKTTRRARWEVVVCAVELAARSELAIIEPACERRSRKIIDLQETKRRVADANEVDERRLQLSTVVVRHSSEPPLGRERRLHSDARTGSTIQ